MAAFSSNIDITSGGTYAMDVTNGETSSKVATDLNGKFANIQELLQNGLPEVWTGSSLPDSLPNGKIINFNNNLYYGQSNAKLATDAQIQNLQNQITSNKSGLLYSRYSGTLDLKSNPIFTIGQHQEASSTINIININVSNVLLCSYQFTYNFNFSFESYGRNAFLDLNICGDAFHYRKDNNGVMNITGTPNGCVLNNIQQLMIVPGIGGGQNEAFNFTFSGIRGSDAVIQQVTTANIIYQFDVIQFIT